MLSAVNKAFSTPRAYSPSARAARPGLPKVRAHGVLAYPVWPSAAMSARDLLSVNMTVQSTSSFQVAHLIGIYCTCLILFFAQYPYVGL